MVSDGWALAATMCYHVNGPEQRVRGAVQSGSESVVASLQTVGEVQLQMRVSEE